MITLIRKKEKNIAFNQRIRINRRIRSPKIQLITSNGDMAGEVSLSEGLKIAEEEGLDLVEINPNANPPVCKILDWGKYQYEKTKNQGVKKRQQETKIIRLGYKIGEHDLDVKAKKAIKFLEKGDKVKASLLFRGREITHREFGEEVLQKLYSKIQEFAEIEKNVSYTGREASMFFTPRKK